MAYPDPWLRRTFAPTRESGDEVATMAIVLQPGDGEAYGSPGLRRDRFMLDGDRTEGRVCVVEHTVAPGVLAGPLHLHTKEDEYSFVLEGRLGALLGDEEVYAEAGDFVAKPRGQWHTFWNAGDGSLRLLEIITPSGLEDLFKVLGQAGEDYDPSELPDLAASYGCEVDFEGPGGRAVRTDVLMALHAQSPKDLEMLLEDAFVLRDTAALADLFEPGAIVASVNGQHRVTDIGDEIWKFAFWSDPRRIVESRRTAVVIGSRAVSVMHGSDDGSWRYAICVFDTPEDAK